MRDQELNINRWETGSVIESLVSRENKKDSRNRNNRSFDRFLTVCVLISLYKTPSVSYVEQSNICFQLLL